jgi:excisionase family DNA binding protein
MSQERRLAYRIEEASEIIGVSRDTLYKLIGEGKLTAVKIGRCRLVSASSLRGLIERGAVGTLENAPTKIPTKVPTRLAAVERRRATFTND